MRVLAAQINPTVGDLEGNTRKIIDALRRAQSENADVVLFPELTLCGYFPDDLLLDRSFIEAMEEQLEAIRPETEGVFAVIGLARKNPSGQEKSLYNSAAVLADAQLLGFKNKTLLPTYDVFDERRYFEPGEAERVWEYRGKKIAVTICEDLWQHGSLLHRDSDYRRDPVEELLKLHPDLVLNLSASPYHFQRTEERISMFRAAAKTLKCPVILCNQVGANDQLIFDGHSLWIDGKGDVVEMAQGFVEAGLIADLEAPKAAHPLAVRPMEDLYAALVLGVRDYFLKQGFRKALIGLSGGIDSALVACIAVKALGSQNVFGITLPSRYSSKGSVEDSLELSRRLGMECQIISIEPLFSAYLSLLEPKFHGMAPNETEENLQARIRGTVLMAFSNKFGYLLLNTGNKSEMAMGYCTLYGDMAGALGVLHDVTKLQVYRLAELAGMIPEAILKKVPSAELREHQTDLDVLPPFEVLDPILEDHVEKGMSPEAIAQKRGQPLPFILELIGKIHAAEYKRRQAPIGLRVTQKAFGKGRVVPIVQRYYGAVPR